MDLGLVVLLATFMELQDQDDNFFRFQGTSTSGSRAFDTRSCGPKSVSYGEGVPEFFQIICR